MIHQGNSLVPCIKLDWPKDKPLLSSLHFHNVELAFYNLNSLEDFYDKEVYLHLNITIKALRLPIIKDLNELIKLLHIALEIARGCDIAILVMDAWWASHKKHEEIIKELLSLSDMLLSEGVSLSWNVSNELDASHVIFLSEESSGAYTLSVDVCRLPNGEEELFQILINYGRLVRVIHMSNRDISANLYGLPIFDIRGSLDYGSILRFLKEMDVDSLLILDYSDEYKTLYIQDLEKIEDYLLSPIV